jgi:hypothetical protein
MQASRYPFSPALLLCALCFLAGEVLGSTGATAAQAVEVIRREKGATQLERLVEMRGEMGEPLPKGWKFVFNDPAARGGVREIVVQDGQILSERTPIRGFGGTGDLPTVSLSRVNLDTNQLFRTVNQAAARQGIGFHWLDYTLRQDTQKGQAVWAVRLTDYLGAKVGDLTLAADNLGVVHNLQREPRDFVDQATVAPRPTPRPRGGVVGRAENLGRNVGETIKRGTLNVAGSVEEWLFGERTIGTEEE